MANEVELISDGEGLAVIGEPSDVDRFLDSAGLEPSRTDVTRFGAVANAGAAAAKVGADLAENSGRWVKLTKESAEAVQKYGLTPSKTPGVSHAMVGQPGNIRQWVQIAKGPGSLANNPALLSGAAGVMSQVAMQQTMAEITAYLERIDQKLDDVLRAQTNQVLARVDGVDLAIQEAVTVRNSVGRVSDVTWSKVQGSTSTILETQAYAMRQLKDLASDLERKSKVGDLADTAKEAETEVEKWLAVLARCFQLHDAVAILELDRVLDSSRDELDRHRLGLKAARQERVELIARTTETLLERMNSAVGTANSRVLMHPIASPSVVHSRNWVASHVHDFHETLGVASGRDTSESRRWLDAAAERWEVVRETGAEGIGTVKQFGNETFDQARSVGTKVTGKVADRVRRRGDDEQLPEDPA